MSAYLDDSAEIKLEEINVAMINFSYSTTNYKRNDYAVDVVALNFLPTYIKFCEKRHEKIFSELKLHYK